MSNPIQRFECDRCGELHAHEFSAEQCCPTAVVEVWECGDCEEVHDSRAAAVACCGGHEEIPRASPRELEAAGQINLLDRLWE